MREIAASVDQEARVRNPRFDIGDLHCADLRAIADPDFSGAIVSTKVNFIADVDQLTRGKCRVTGVNIARQMCVRVPGTALRICHD